MKIHTDHLTPADLYAAAPDLVQVHVMQVGSRSRRYGFNVSLEYLGAKVKGRRWANQNTWDAASWDEWGVWMAALYELDPAAVIGPYADRQAFYDQTARWQPRGMVAPWLARVPISEVSDNRE